MGPHPPPAPIVEHDLDVILGRRRLRFPEPLESKFLSDYARRSLFPTALSELSPG